MKKIAHNWYYVAALLIGLLLVLHYSGFLDKTIVNNSEEEVVVERTDIEKLQEQVEQELADAREFDEIAPVGSRDPEAVDGYTMTGSGLQYKIVSATDEGQYPTAQNTVRVHYHGTLMDGTVFDSSVDRGVPASFALYQVIPGWTEGLQLMSEGDTFDFIIPAVLAYGDSGAGDKIGPNETLRFEVELLEIIK